MNIGLLILISTTLSLSAAAQSLKVLITVSKDKSNSEWVKETCQTLHMGLNQSAMQVYSRCDWRQNEMLTSVSRTAKNSGEFTYAVDFHQNLNGSAEVRIVNWKPSDDLDFHQSGWKIDKNDSQEQILFRLMTNLMNYHQNKRSVRTLLLLEGIDNSQVLKVNTKNKDFIDSHSGLPLNSEQAVEVFSNENQRNKNYMRAGIELLVAWGAGTGWYYSVLEEMKKDWDYTLRQSIRGNFNGDRSHFDDNSWETNWGHAYAGIPYYMICRGNGLSSLESFLCTFGTSLIWETVTEFREVLSINDMVATTMGGFYMGESLHQLGKFFNAKKNNVVYQALAVAFDSPSAMSNYIDKNISKKGADWTRAGYNQDVWGNVELYVSSERITSTSKSGGISQRATRIGFNSEITNVPNWEGVGRIREFKTDTLFAKFLVEGDSGGELGKNFNLLSQVTFAGWLEKNIGTDKDGQIAGYNWYIGPSGGVEMHTRKNPNDDNKYDDFFGIINVIGATAHISMYSRGWKIQATINIFADFAMIRNYNIDRYKADIGSNGLPTVLANQDMYYAVGHTNRGQIIAEYNKIAFGLNFSTSDWNSVTDRYRFQDQITNNLNLNDGKDSVGAFISHKIAHGLSVRFHIARIRRHGQIKNFGQRKSFENQYGVSLVYNF